MPAARSAGIFSAALRHWRSRTVSGSRPPKPVDKNKGGHTSKSAFRWWKFIAIWVCFLLLHFSYEWFPGVALRVLAEANETVFFHMKMLFVAYVLVSLAEYFASRHSIRSTGSFFASRALVAVAYPWLAITFWFLAWALGVTFGRAGELIYANITTLLGVYLALRMDEILDTLVLRPALQWTIYLLFLAAVISYVSFSLHPPLHFFTTPPG
ncbi:MAG: hypothetical protein ACM3PS_08875 [Syntrophothermus sp.]